MQSCDQFDALNSLDLLRSMRLRVSEMPSDQKWESICCGSLIYAEAEAEAGKEKCAGPNEREPT
jgi:hypothetical protein